MEQLGHFECRGRGRWGFRNSLHTLPVWEASTKKTHKECNCKEAIKIGWKKINAEKTETKGKIEKNKTKTVETEVRCVCERDVYAEIVGERVKAGERRSQLSPKKKISANTKPCLLYMRALWNLKAMLFNMTLIPRTLASFHALHIVHQQQYCTAKAGTSMTSKLALMNNFSSPWSYTVYNRFHKS